MHLQCFSVCIFEDFFSVRESVPPFLVRGKTRAAAAGGGGVGGGVERGGLSYWEVWVVGCGWGRGKERGGLSQESNCFTITLQRCVTLVQLCPVQKFGWVGAGGAV